MPELVGNDIARACRHPLDSRARHRSGRPVARLVLPPRAPPARLRYQGAHRLDDRTAGAVRSALERRVRRRVALARRRIAHAARASRPRTGDARYQRTRAAARPVAPPRDAPVLRGAFPFLRARSRRDDQPRRVRFVALDVCRPRGGTGRSRDRLRVRCCGPQVAPRRVLARARQRRLRFPPAPLLPLRAVRERQVGVRRGHGDAARRAADGYISGRLLSAAGIRSAPVLLLPGSFHFRRAAAAGAIRPRQDCCPQGRGTSTCCGKGTRLAESKGGAVVRIY
mmetsp:Transcript_30904/g.46861  ORF Transcript_30904/g.46861 Transcript_30904/m.46861 type:complete len:282 (-) Transcript_30904:220-1065(-)